MSRVELNQLLEVFSLSKALFAANFKRLLRRIWSGFALVVAVDGISLKAEGKMCVSEGSIPLFERYESSAIEADNHSMNWRYYNGLLSSITSNKPLTYKFHIRWSSSLIDIELNRWYHTHTQNKKTSSLAVFKRNQLADPYLLLILHRPSKAKGGMIEADSCGGVVVGRISFIERIMMHSNIIVGLKNEE